MHSFNATTEDDTMTKTLTTIVTAVALFWNVGVMASEHTPLFPEYAAKVSNANKLFEIASEQCAKNYMQVGPRAVTSAACEQHNQMIHSFAPNKETEQMGMIEEQICDFEEYVDDPTCFDWAPQQTGMSEQMKVLYRNFHLKQEASNIAFKAR
jgi:hypothetical protein